MMEDHQHHPLEARRKEDPLKSSQEFQEDSQRPAYPCQEQEDFLKEAVMGKSKKGPQRSWEHRQRLAQSWLLALTTRPHMSKIEK